MQFKADVPPWLEYATMQLSSRINFQSPKRIVQHSQLDLWIARPVGPVIQRRYLHASIRMDQP